MPLPADATLISQLNELQNPKKYLTAALDRLRECADKHGDARVSIGRQGNGTMPMFRVMYGVDQWFGRYGAAGGPFTSEGDPQKVHAPDDQFWSDRFSTIAEIEAVLSLLKHG